MSDLSANRQAQPGSPALATATLVVGRVTLVAIVVQFALAGLGTFSRQHKHVFDGYFEPHQMLGYTISGLALVFVVLGVAARLGRRFVGLGVVLVVLAGPVQPLLAKWGDSTSGWFGAAHALSGVAITGIVGFLTATLTAPRRAA
jgi:hypothetical protein